MSTGPHDVGGQPDPYGQQSSGQPPYGAPPPDPYAPPGYGQPAYPPPGQVPPYGYGGPVPYPPVPGPTNAMGVAGFVVGLVGLLLFWIPFLGFLLSATGVVLSGVGMAQGRKTGAPTGLAIAGLVCGISGTVLGLFILLVALAASSG